MDARIIAEHVLKYVTEIQVSHPFFRLLTVNKASILKQSFAFKDVCFENAYIFAEFLCKGKETGLIQG